MLVLFETSSGYVILKVLDEKKLQKPENLYREFETPEKFCKFLTMKHFEKFQTLEEALESTSATMKSNPSEKLIECLKKTFAENAQEELAVADAKLGHLIHSKLNVNCVYNEAIFELQRCIRAHLSTFLKRLNEKDPISMTFSVAHGLSRYKLKFITDKIDKMVIEAVAALDDLDKEMNNYIVICKEWYSSHFPELSKILTDNILYIKTVIELGFRSNATNTDFLGILSVEDATKVKELAEISMGADITEEDLKNIQNVCKEVLEMQICREKLYEYLKNRMTAIAPNVTALVGEMVGARLIAHAGSLVNLAKYPASTIQILGAEKALFRALKTRNNTPKYGLIYHAQLIGQSHNRLKGKLSRMLTAKTALASRIDAFGKEESVLGLKHRMKLEQAMKILEDKNTRYGRSGKSKAQPYKYKNKSKVLQHKVSDDFTFEKRNKKRKF